VARGPSYHSVLAGRTIGIANAGFGAIPPREY
jgi:hypothetical protein